MNEKKNANLEIISPHFSHFTSHGGAERYDATNTLGSNEWC